MSYTSVNYWLKAGTPAHKLVLGIPTYGRSWTLATHNTALNSSASGTGDKGPITAERGFMAYNEICRNIQQEGWTKVSDPSGSMGPYAYKGNQWVGYDDPAMAAVKAKYIVSNQLGGAMVWDLPSDDFKNRFGGGHYPIIRAVSDILRGESSTQNYLPVPDGSRQKDTDSTLQTLFTISSSPIASSIAVTTLPNQCPTNKHSNQDKPSLHKTGDYIHYISFTFLILSQCHVSMK